MKKVKIMLKNKVFKVKYLFYIKETSSISER